MDKSKQTAKDLIAHYFSNEADHIPLLIAFLKNEKSLDKNTLYSNLFNFKVDFEKNEVIIEDQCGLFSDSNPEGSQKTTIEKLLFLCNKTMNKK